MDVLNVSRKLSLVLPAAAAFALLLTTAFSLRTATATPQYAAQTKLACAACHANPAGGGALTARGKKFQDNGHKL